ncbi:MAG: N5-glutamine methyltransferase family protein [Candidatus Dormibacteria bacterium]
MTPTAQPQTTVESALREAARAIVASPHCDLWRKSVGRADAEDLMALCLGKRPRDTTRLLKPGQLKRFRKLVDRRVSGEPVALIQGYMDFNGIRLRLKRGVFTPRYSSEFMAAQAIKRLRGRRKPNAVDVATGAGPVALSVADRLPKAHAWGVDISKPAVSLARRNARDLGLRNTTFKVSDLVQALPRRLRESVDVITFHPPYVARRDVRTLPTEIRDFEPPQALTDSSVDGLGLVRRLAEEANQWLRPGGWLLIEVAPDLSRSVRAILKPHGFTELEILRDSLGATRVVAARRAPITD